MRSLLHLILCAAKVAGMGNMDTGHLIDTRLSSFRSYPSVQRYGAKLLIALLGLSVPAEAGAPSSALTGLTLLETYLVSVDSYMYPSNAESGTQYLTNFLTDITTAFVKRVGRENGLSMAGVEPQGTRFRRFLWLVESVLVNHTSPGYPKCSSLHLVVRLLWQPSSCFWGNRVV